MVENIRGFFENLFVILFFEYYCDLNFLNITWFEIWMLLWILPWNTATRKS